ncbi:MAG: hypothetical protein ACXWB0_00250 [Sulfuricurvum sp.]
MSTKNLVGIVASAVIIGAMGYMIMNETSGKQGDSSSKETQISTSNGNRFDAAPTNKEALTEEERKIKDLKDENREFEVSNLYILKCAPCHGDGGKGLIGPPLYGKSEAEIMKKLSDYKEGRVKNSMMAGLLTNSTEDELKTLANEISKFGH